MYGKTIIILLLVFLLPLVCAIQPVLQTSNTNGLLIKYPNDQQFKLGQDYEFEFHVYNASSGLPITTGISCYFHLYNSSGNHYLELVDVTASHNFDYSFYVSGGNFSKIGQIYYNVQCNSSSLGGFDNIPIWITQSGEETTVTGSINIFASLILIIFVSVFLLALGFAFNSSAARIILFGLGGIILIIAILYSTVILNETIWSSLPIVEGFSTFWFVMKILIGLALVILVIYTLFLAYSYWAFKRGFSD